MKKTMWIALALLVLLQLNGPPEVEARGRHHSHVGVNLWLGPEVFTPFFYPSYGTYYSHYPYYPYYTAPPVVIERQPQEYIVRPDPEPEAPTYWYYCQDPKGYYPYVQRCPSGWMKVVPSAPPAD